MPYLDYRLVEATLSSPSNQNINKGETKHILREAILMLKLPRYNTKSILKEMLIIRKKYGNGLIWNFGFKDLMIIFNIIY